MDINEQTAEEKAAYEEYVRRNIEAGRRQLENGEGIPAEQVWEELGINDEIK